MFSLMPLELKNRNLWPDLLNEDFFNIGSASFKTDIKETDKEYLIEAELPGFAKDDLEVVYRDGSLTISAKRDEVAEEAKGNYLRKERRTGQVMRTFVFDNLDTDNVKAEYKDGVLKLNLPKKEVSAPEVRKIEIN